VSREGKGTCFGVYAGKTRVDPRDKVIEPPSHILPPPPTRQTPDADRLRTEAATANHATASPSPATLFHFADQTDTKSRPDEGTAKTQRGSYIIPSAQAEPESPSNRRHALYTPAEKSTLRPEYLIITRPQVLALVRHSARVRIQRKCIKPWASGIGGSAACTVIPRPRPPTSASSSDHHTTTPTARRPSLFLLDLYKYRC
jgi:hypothetical protein